MRVVVLVLLLGATLLDASHPCRECLDTYNFLQHVGSDEPSLDPCLHIPHTDQCHEIQRVLTEGHSSQHPCMNLQICDNSTFSSNSSLATQTRMEDLASLSSPLKTAVDLLQTEVGRRKKKGMPEKDKFALKIFFYSIKMILPCFRMLYYERGITKANRPEKPPSLLEISETVTAGPLRPMLDPAEFPMPPELETAISLLETSSATGVSTQVFWFFMYIGHWLLRYVHWFSWIIKFRLLRVRYWMTSKHDDASFLYRPHISGWGWDSYYQYWYGGGGGGGGSGGSGAIKPEEDKDFRAEDDKSVIIPPPGEDLSSDDTPAYDLHNPNNERYHPDEINNEDQIVAKVYNWYDVNDSKYYPDADDQKFFKAPIFGQPARNLSKIQNEAFGPDLLIQKGFQETELEKKREPDYAEIEKMAEAAMTQVMSKGSDAQPIPIGNHDAILGNGVSLKRAVKSTSQPVAESVPASASAPKAAISSTLKSNITSAGSDAVAAAMEAAKKVVVKQDKYEKLRQFKFADSQTEFQLLPEEEQQVRSKMHEFHQVDKDVHDFVAPNQPVNDRTADYVADSDDVEKDLVGALDHEYQSLESSRPRELDDSNKWGGFDDIGLLQNAAELIDSELHVTEDTATRHSAENNN